MLKSDFHCHSGFDMGDEKLPYTSKELISYAAKLGYGVLALTNHDDVIHTKELNEYAKRKGVLIIPACERTIEDKHVVLLDITQKQMENIKTLSDLEKYKKENILAMAAHPFFPHKSALREQLIEHINLFEAIEWSHFYTPWFNFNKKAAVIAEKYNKTLLGTSDCHWFEQLNHTFTLVDSKKTKESVLEAVRKNSIKLQTNPLPPMRFTKLLYWVFIEEVKHVLKKPKGSV